MKSAKPKAKSAKKKLSEAEKKQNRIQRAHKSVVRGSFSRSGFQSITQVRDVEFSFNHVTSDFDDCFVSENVVVLVEYTVSKEDGVGDHIKKKQGVYNEVLSKKLDFWRFLKGKFPDLGAAVDGRFPEHKINLIILYCSLSPVKSQHKSLLPNVVFYDYHIARYFEAVTKATKLSSRFELYEFFGLKNSDVGEAALKPANQVTSDSFNCSVLPETHSNFGSGYKVVTFYASPEAILPRACVLRKYGWLDREHAYQRLISNKKISDIRRYLMKEKRVFINNIIATLPSGAKILDSDQNTIDPAKILDTEPGIVSLPAAFNSVGLIDGQHRVYSYHEGGEHEKEISPMRSRQNLLITGIIFPPGLSDAERLKFEARLFLEINANQTNAKSDLKQEITSILEPYSSDAMARRVLARLNDESGPLRDCFQRFSFEADLLKTSSVVSFALKPLLTTGGAVWNAVGQDVIDGIAAEDDAKLEEYTIFATEAINRIFSGVRANVSNKMWVSDRKVSGHFLTVRNVNAIIACLRHSLPKNGSLDISEYISAFSGISNFPFQNYGSSKYNAMGEQLFLKFLDRGQ